MSEWGPTTFVHRLYSKSEKLILNIFWNFCGSPGSGGPTMDWDKVGGCLTAILENLVGQIWVWKIRPTSTWVGSGRRSSVGKWIPLYVEEVSPLQGECWSEGKWRSGVYDFTFDDCFYDWVDSGSGGLPLKVWYWSDCFTTTGSDTRVSDSLALVGMLRSDWKFVSWRRLLRAWPNNDCYDLLQLGSTIVKSRSLFCRSEQLPGWSCQ